MPNRIGQILEPLWGRSFAEPRPTDRAIAKINHVATVPVTSDSNEIPAATTHTRTFTNHTAAKTSSEWCG